MPLLSVGVLLLVLAWAIREDAIRNVIPNKLNLAAILVALGASYLDGGVHGFGASVAGALVGGAVLAPFYLLGGMGAGDVKLMAASGAFLGPSNALLAAALGIVFGGVVATAIVLWRLSQPRPVFGALCVDRAQAVPDIGSKFSAARKQRFPYAIAIAAGVITTLAMQGSLYQLYSIWASW